MLTGGCSCGGVRYQIDATPLVMYHCHCELCRRTNGASVATNILVPTGSFSVTKGASLLTAWESSPRKWRHFCSRCGSPIFSAAEATDAIRSVRCGTLDGDPGLRPSLHVYVAAKAPWTVIADGLPQKQAGMADA